MTGPPLMYPKAWEVAFTRKAATALQTEALLTNTSVSAVVREAVDAYYATPPQPARAARSPPGKQVSHDPTNYTTRARE